MSLRNTGTEPISLLAIFPRPGFEEYLRDVSVPDGERAEPLSVAELRAVWARHRDHIIFEPR